VSSAVFDYKQIHQIWERKAKSSVKFDRMTLFLKRESKAIKADWGTYSSEKRNSLKEFAYSLLESPKGIQGFLASLRSKLYFFFLDAAQKEALVSCLEAIDLLVDTILDCIEQDDPAYQVVLYDTLEELRLNHERIPEVKPEDTSAWLRDIFDEAVR